MALCVMSRVLWVRISLLYTKRSALRSKLDPFNEEIDLYFIAYGATTLSTKALVDPVVGPFKHSCGLEPTSITAPWIWTEAEYFKWQLH